MKVVSFLVLMKQLQHLLLKISTYYAISDTALFSKFTSFT